MDYAERIARLRAKNPTADLAYLGGRAVDLRAATPPRAYTAATPSLGAPRPPATAPSSETPIVGEARRLAELEARERSSAIATMCCSAGLMEMAGDLITSNVSVADARQQIDRRLADSVLEARQGKRSALDGATPEEQEAARIIATILPARDHQ